MALIFISHSTKDKAEALQLMHWLECHGFESLFLDSDARHGIAAGSEWEKVLYREIQRSHALICLLSEHWLASQWCGFEFMQARALGKTIFPLRIQPGLQTTVAADLQHLDLTKDRDDALQRLHAQLTELTLTLQQRFDWDKTRPPFPGMLAFEAEDAPVFFGRDHETNQLRERLNQHRTLGNASVLLMLAASGAGKSSLLKAGLLPRLRRDTRHWIVLEALRPEREPLRKLAQVLATANGTPQQAADLYAQLQGEQALPALRDYLEQLRTPNAQWDATLLLSIDQAEELFTTAEPQQTQALFRLLLAAQQAKLPLLTLMAMRSDYLATLQAQVSETGAQETSLFALDPLPLERVSDLIRGPAGVVGLTVEDALVTAATRDAATADALPLLAFALRELYERFGADGDLTLDDASVLSTSIRWKMRCSTKPVLPSSPTAWGRQHCKPCVMPSSRIWYGSMTRATTCAKRRIGKPCLPLPTNCSTNSPMPACWCNAAPTGSSGWKWRMKPCYATGNCSTAGCAKNTTSCSASNNSNTACASGNACPTRTRTRGCCRALRWNGRGNGCLPTAPA